MKIAFRQLCAVSLTGLSLSLANIAPAIAQQSLLSTDGELSASDERLQDDSPFDIHRFEGVAGQLIQVLMESSDFDTYVFLLDANGEVLDQNDDYDAAHGTNSIIDFELPQDGQYQILANAYDSSGRGRYQLTVSEMLDASAATDQTTVALSENECVQALEQVEARLTEGRSLTVPYQTELDPYGDFPAERPIIYSVAMQGAETESVLNSPELLTSIGSEFISNCESAGALSIGQYQSGYRVIFGVVDSQLQFFGCAEDLDDYGRNIPWGYYRCEL